MVEIHQLHCQTQELNFHGASYSKVYSGPWAFYSWLIYLFRDLSRVAWVIMANDSGTLYLMKQMEKIKLWTNCFVKKKKKGRVDKGRVVRPALRLRPEDQELEANLHYMKPLSHLRKQQQERRWSSRLWSVCTVQYVHCVLWSVCTVECVHYGVMCIVELCALWSVCTVELCALRSVCTVECVHCGVCTL